MEIIKNTTTEVWKDALSYIMGFGEKLKDNNSRNSIEVMDLKLQIKEAFIDISKPIETLTGFNKWMYPSMEEISSIMLGKKLSPAYSYSYGSAIFNYDEKINQVDDFVIPLLRRESNSRRAVVSLWNPHKDSNVHKTLMPGLLLVDFKVRNNKLHLTSFVRSNDIFFGWPANIYQLYLLQNYVRDKLNLEPGDLTTFSTSAHIFEDQLEHIEKVLQQR